MKTLLTGKPYVPAVETDLKKTFARIRREQEQAKKTLAAEEAALKGKVKHIGRGKA